MAYIKYSALLPHILPECPGLSEPMAENALRDAVIELCRTTRIWRITMDPIYMVTSAGTYDIQDLPRQSILNTVMSVSAGGRALDAVSEDELDLRYPNWRTDSGTPRYYTQVERNTITVTPRPSQTLRDSVVISLSLMPSRASTEFPDWINDVHQRAIIAGAKSRLMQIPGQTWSNPNLAIYYENEAKAQAALASDAATRSSVRARLRTVSQH